MAGSRIHKGGGLNPSAALHSHRTLHGLEPQFPLIAKPPRMKASAWGLAHGTVWRVAAGILLPTLSPSLPAVGPGTMGAFISSS